MSSELRADLRPSFPAGTLPMRIVELDHDQAEIERLSTQVWTSVETKRR